MSEKQNEKEINLKGSKTIKSPNKNTIFADTTRQIRISLPKLPFDEIAKQQNLSRPLREALKKAYGWNNSSLLTVDELNKATQKWLSLKPSDERKRGRVQ